MPTNWPIRTPLIWSIAFGASFGLLFRLIAAFHWLSSPQQNVTAIMTLSYLALGSAVVGYVTIWCAEIKGKRPIWQWIVVPWCSMLVVMLATALLVLEGAICLVFGLPIFLVFSSIGGVVAGVLRRKAPPSITAQLCIVALPMLLPQLETRVPRPLKIRTVQTDIAIAAPAAVVWENIASVPPIRPQELPDTWTERVGFPKPIAATLSFQGIGGVRNATFERGLTFFETVTVWKPDHQLSFTIKADTAHIPPTTLDRHATIGGPYFDVLNGDYQIKELTPGHVVLHLSSHERLSTDFNDYAGFWADAVMRSIQNSILQVIKHRSESANPQSQN